MAEEKSTSPMPQEEFNGATKFTFPLLCGDPLFNFCRFTLALRQLSIRRIAYSVISMPRISPTASLGYP
ncbi:hypothetical protein J6590_050591 [Homalodisca vitripennis]|nr:hypothetical protein J6590_050591 [Homalodisca vitripennis]